MIKHNAAFILFLFVSAACFISCTQQRDPCLQPRTMQLNIHTYQKADTATLDTVLPHPFIAAIDFTDSIKVVSDTGTGNQRFGIYLSPRVDSARWLIWPDAANSDPGDADTITFYYSKSLQFLSTACGYTYFYNLKSVHTTNNSIDSVVITTYDVNSDASKEHLKIYY